MSIATSAPDADNVLQFGRKGKLPLLLQAEATECGLACLAMVSGYHGYDTDIISIRQKFSVSSRGVTLKNLIELASQLSLSARALRLEMDDLPKLQTPCILHWDLNHFVVLKKATKHKVIIHDPAIGERHLNYQEVNKSFTGIALELTPTHGFEAGQARKTLTLSQFWNKITGLRRSLSIVFVLSLLLQLFAIAAPYYMQLVVDEVVLRSDTNLLRVLALGFGLLLCIEVGTACLRQFILLNFSSRLNMQMASNIFSHLIRLPMDYFAKRHIGDVVSRFGSMTQIRELLTTGLVQVLLDGLMAVIILIVMVIYSPGLTIVVLGVVAFYALVRLLFYSPVRRLAEEQLVASAKEQSHFMESVRAIQTIKLCEKEAERHNQWQNRFAGALNKSIRLSRWEIGFDTINRFLFGIENIVIIFFAAMFVMDNLMTVGMLFAFISYKSRFIGAMDNLIVKWIEFKMLSVHFDRLADIVFTPQDQSVRSQSLEYGRFSARVCQPKLEGHLQIRNLSYAYSAQDKPIFSHLDLEINAGQTVAIVGPSGSGKTTLLKCLMGLFQPTTGHIFVDNQPLDQFADYRQQISAVMQDDQLLSGSIGDNITCFDNQPEQDQMFVAAHLACIHEEITNMPMRYNTLVGDMGASLSGGQKQRILLARALYRRPSILFLDEATCHLDTDNEATINQHIKNLSVTRIIIAHRPSTIRMADRVIRLEAGQVSDITDEVKASSIPLA